MRSHFLEQWLEWIVAISWQIALLVAIVSVIALLSWQASPRWRHALWLLIVLKVFLPPGLTAPWSVGQWLVAPAVDRLVGAEWASFGTSSAMAADETDRERRGPHENDAMHARQLPVAIWLFGIWGTGCVIFWGMVVGNFVLLRNAMASADVIDEGPIRVALERLALACRIQRIPDIVATDLVRSPLLCGLFRPAIVIPKSALPALNEADINAVLTHELVHWRRCDTWTGWLQVIAQGLLWFHPLMWWANRQLRHERERACDEEVLQLATFTPQDYGESLVRVLTATRGRSHLAGGHLGILERGLHLQIRLEDIMNFEPNKHRFGTTARMAVTAIAILLIPMGIGNHGRQIATAQQATEAPAPPRADTPYPTIVKSVPATGDTDVDPGLKEISITFDRDMQEGMSWTGGPPDFPATDKARRPRWVDARTCVLPVKLDRAHYYRVGVNSTSHRNFQSQQKVPVPPTAIFFTTQGASAETKAQATIPTIVAMVPANGADDVDPAITEVRVTFSIPMQASMSWTGSRPEFPAVPDGKQPHWSEDQKTCTLPVSLGPGHSYRLGLNSPSHKNFTSRWGVPLSPVVYTFQTR